MAGLITWFLALLVLGVPVALVLGISSTIFLITEAQVPLSILAQRYFGGLDQFVLMSIPFFILAGLLMNEAQLTGRLVQIANYLVGWLKGGLAQVNVLTSMFFGGITGAATADVAAVGSILIPAMVKEGYRREFAVAVTVASSVVGPLIPPSIPMLVYGISSGASIGALFLAGVTPGIAVGLSMLILNRYLVRGMELKSLPAWNEAPEVGWRGHMTGLGSGLIALMMPVIIVGGVVGGVFTPTESSVAAVIYALIVGVVLRRIKLKALWELIAKASLISATIMLIIANASLLGWVLAYEQIPQAVAQTFLAVTGNAEIFLFLVSILLLVTGLFMEPSGAIIILTPVLLPAAESFGINPVHFGVVIVFGLVIGLVTPPVGLCLFIGSSIGGVPFHVLSREVLPYVGLLILIFLFFVFFPEASLWLPNLMAK